MIGRRVWDFEPDRMEPGDYGKHPDRASAEGPWFDAWWVCTPNGLLGRLSSAEDFADHHHVEEHADGTISVMPQPGNSNSILVEGWPLGLGLGTRADGEPLKSWHGYIDHGAWSSA